MLWYSGSAGYEKKGNIRGQGRMGLFLMKPLANMNYRVSLLIQALIYYLPPSPSPIIL